MASKYFMPSRVTHAPGGPSSLSLSWEAPQSVRPPKKVQAPQSHSKPLSYIFQPSIEKSSISLPSNDAAYMSLSDSNRFLEEQLLYYQQKNKMLREQLFGGGQFSRAELLNNQRGIYESKPISSSRYYQSRLWEDKYNSLQQPEELQLAVQERERRRKTYQRQQLERSRYQNSQQIKSAVKVTHPPGGHSSIVFG